MGHLENTTVRNAYLQSLMDEGFVEAYRKKALNEDKPLFDPHYLSDEEEPKYEHVNQNVLESIFDILNLSFNCIDSASNIKELLSDVDNRIASVNEKIAAEEERVRDVNMICGNVTDLNSIIPITAGHFTLKSTLYQYKNCLTASVSNEKKVNLTLLNVNGNGYSGNRYTELYEARNTDKAEYMFDDTKNTSWEYSRLFSYDDINKSDIVNIDDLPSEVQLTFEGDEEFNQFVFSDSSLVHITKIEISPNGSEWRTTFEGDIVPNKHDNSYSDFTYIYGSGALIFPVTRYLRLTVYSHHIDKEPIIINEQIKPGVFRKVIKMTSVEARRNIFSNGYGTTDNIITSGKAICAGLFCNEYVPEFMRNDIPDIKYWLIVNGRTYDIIPINSNRRGIKLIKYNKMPRREAYVEYIEEPITSLQIGISIPTAYNYSPYIANLKLCLGKQISNV